LIEFEFAACLTNLSSFTAEMMMSRADGSYLIPFYGKSKRCRSNLLYIVRYLALIRFPLSFGISDMFNSGGTYDKGYNIAHQYSPWFDRIDQKGYELYATTSIGAGEELLTPYNR